MTNAQKIAVKFCKENGIEDPVIIGKLAILADGLCMVISAQCLSEYYPDKLRGMLIPPKTLNDIKNFNTDGGQSLI